MDFNDFRLFVMPEALPGRGPHTMESSRREPSESRFSDVCLTDVCDDVADMDTDDEYCPESVGSAVNKQTVVKPKDNLYDRTQPLETSVRTDWSMISECPRQSMLDPLDLHEEDWSRVSINDDGDIETESLSPALSPACLPVTDDQRMSKSLDLGHEELGAEMMNSNSLPWQSRARTLDSPHKTSSNAADKINRKQSTINDGDKIKFKLMSAWNNMKFGMKPKTSFRVDAPIWLLGMCYNCTREQVEQEHNSNVSQRRTNMAFEHFKKDFISKIWLTYRQMFPALAGSQLTTDVGWGCMLRSGQMMLAHALVLHFLHRDWRWHAHQKKYEVVFHQQIIKFFGDSPDKECPFSIHRLVEIGAESGKKPGDWYGPASVAFVLREAVARAPMLNALLSHICLYVAQDCTIYKQDVMDLCCQRSAYQGRPGMSPGGSKADDMWRAVIILIPVRLGGEALNPIYISCVSSMLSHDLCVGVIGGRPKHSLYFIGWQEDKLIYLDPHLCQDNVDVRDRKFPLQTFHCMSPRKMSFSRMDPSCTIGFYCRTKADFIRFVQDSEQMASPPKERGQYPMYVFQDGRSTDLMATDMQTNEDRYLRVRRLDRKGRPKGKAKEADDFVFL